jgi:hypothetical protein
MGHLNKGGLGNIHGVARNLMAQAVDRVAWWVSVEAVWLVECACKPVMQAWVGGPGVAFHAAEASREKGGSVALIYVPPH